MMRVHNESGKGMGWGQGAGIGMDYWLLFVVGLFTSSLFSVQAHCVLAFTGIIPTQGRICGERERGCVGVLYILYLARAEESLFFFSRPGGRTGGGPVGIQPRGSFWDGLITEWVFMGRTGNRSRDRAKPLALLSFFFMFCVILWELPPTCSDPKKGTADFAGNKSADGLLAKKMMD
ncbi:hypothetical protein B0H67DRAFT_298481 [Lasiosphaeris hirsuta]|uniref:Uncharacterized protein n=1 Tax=Lasiosphaeris hirsuta TaxID=260670 RepID=A0AA40A9G7_9PEZI|nr:hypothetical protein B0H67DRAFT_298481 [Lasiosphaeris hirsuta]